MREKKYLRSTIGLLIPTSIPTIYPRTYLCYLSIYLSHYNIYILRVHICLPILSYLTNYNTNLASYTIYPRTYLCYLSIYLSFYNIYILYAYLYCLIYLTIIPILLPIYYLSTVSIIYRGF